MGKILVADDSSTIQKVVRITLANEQHQLVECMSEAEMDKLLKAHQFDLILLDYNLSTTLSGNQLIQKIRKSSTAPVMAMLGTFDTVDQQEITRAGYADSIVKPFESEVFIAKCRRLISDMDVSDSPDLMDMSDIPAPIEEEAPMDADLELDSWTVKNEASLPPKMESAEELTLESTPEENPTSLNRELEDWGIEIPSIIGEKGGEMELPPIIGGVDELAQFDLKSTDTLAPVEESEEVHFDLDSTSSFDIREFEAKFDQTLPPDSDLAYPDNSNVEDMDMNLVLESKESDEGEDDPFSGMNVEMVSLDDLDPEEESDDIAFEQTDPHHDPEIELEMEKEVESESLDDLWAVDETFPAAPSSLPKVESYGGIETNADFVEHIQFHAQEEQVNEVKSAPEVAMASISIDELAEKLRESLAPMIETIIRQECLRIADQVAEKVAWEVIPDLAENVIRKEIKALTDSVE